MGKILKENWSTSDSMWNITILLYLCVKIMFSIIKWYWNDFKRTLNVIISCIHYHRNGEVADPNFPTASTK